jgi:hypothetical protein
LINMAQLHTINVTSDFVRKALNEYSKMFEISEDGRKVRWKGGRGITSSDSGGGSSNDRVSDATPDGQSPRKRPKLSHRTSATTNASQQQTGSGSQRLHPDHKYQYTPLFFHRDSTDDADDSSSEAEDNSMSSPFPAPVAGNSSGMTSSGIRTSSGLAAMSIKKKPKREDGPIIFYNNARFCTDLSGERKPNGNPDAPMYTTLSSVPIGKPRNTTNQVIEKRGPLNETSELPEPMDLSDNPIPESMEVAFPPSSPFKNQIPANKQQPMDLEVTGIGGVWPSDNFAINVQSRYARVNKGEVSDASTNTTSKSVPPRFAKILHNSDSKADTRTLVHSTITSLKHEQLPPSVLPPAVTYMDMEEAMEDDESDGEDDGSIAPESPGAFPPSAAPQPVDIPYLSSDEDEEEEDSSSEIDDDDNSSDDSLDLLAAAREVDPDAIREKEREYDANMAERLAEEIPAGSSAATAGGGSGFASPASGMRPEEYKRAVREARAKSASLQRARTSDSMVVQGTRESSSSSDDEDEEMDDVRS